MESGGDFANEKLEALASLSNLEELAFEIKSLSDLVIPTISQLPKLRELDLRSSGRLTDAGLTHLKSSKSLKELNINGTKVTAAGIAELKKSLPELKVYGP